MSAQTTFSPSFQDLQRRYRPCALAGFIALSLGYLLRDQLQPAGGGLGLFLGVFPNLFGSFSTPFILWMLALSRYPALQNRPRLAMFGLANLVTLAGALVIEYGHVALNLGTWDGYDVAASVIGGVGAMLLFALTNRPEPS